MSSDAYTTTGTGAELVKSPNLTQSGKITQTAVADFSQAYAACKGLENANIERDRNDSIIEVKYNGGAPYSQAKLVEEKQGWRFNISTGALSSLVDRKVPELVNPIIESKILTGATLDPIIFGKDADRKSTFFQRRFTRMVKEWEEYSDWLDDQAMENVLYGRGLSAWTELLDWRPECFPHGSYYLPDGNRMLPHLTQAVALKRPLLIHEAIDRVTKSSLSESAGWNVENLVKVINDASPQKLDFNVGDGWRQQADATKEWSNCWSYQQGAKVIELYDYLAAEPNGTVTQVTMERRSGTGIYFFPSRFTQMSDCIALFTMQPGNRKFYGSKGIGRNCLNITNAMEQIRNLFLDSVKLSTVVPFKITPQQMAKLSQLQFVMTNPFCFLGVEGEQMQDAFDTNPELFAAADNKLSALAELLAGAVLPGQVDAQNQVETTATQAKIEESQRLQLKAGILTRWIVQMFRAHSTMQRRACDPRTNDPEALKFQEDCMAEGITRDELDYLAKQPCLKTVEDIEIMRKGEVQFVMSTMGASPYINQKELQKATLERTISEELLERVWIDDETDQTIKSEAVRLQQMESAAMLADEEVPVSPRDNHQVHLDVLMENFKKLAAGLAATPNAILLTGGNHALNHAMQHLQMWKAAGALPDVTAPYEQMLGQVKQGLDQANEQFKQAEQTGAVPPQSAVA